MPGGKSPAGEAATPEPQVGDYFWVGVRKQKGAYAPARLVDVRKSKNKTQYVVQDWGAARESDQRTVSSLGPRIEDIEKTNSVATDDLVRLHVVDRKAIMWLLKNRLSQELIYTRVGDILVSVNPFKRINVFRPEDMRHYQETPLTQTAPHPYEIMKRSYDDLVRSGRDQSLLISGESGAGKTFTVRVALAYLASVAGSPAKIEDLIMAGNPIFETFGNAKTQRNDNSSRFGKFAKIGVDQMSGNLVKCDTETYLLEKSRVAVRGSGERNFHIFYYITTLLGEDEKAKLRLGVAQDYAYLGRGNPKAVYTTNPELHNDEEEFAAMEKAFKMLGFTGEDRWNLYSCMAAILHLGNIEIDAVESTNGSAVSSASTASVRNAAELLGVAHEEDKLRAGLTKNVKPINGKLTDFIYSQAKAIGARDALAKDIYGKVFDWLRLTLNDKMAGTASDGMAYPAIGMLDIFGFEEFKNNSFEQLCINFANEKLQQIFNKHTFDLEAKTYQEEGIPYEVVEYADNQPLLDMLGLPKRANRRTVTIYSVLDEKTNLESASDADFLSAIKRHFGRKGGGGKKGNKKKGEALFDGFVRDSEADNPGLCFKIRHYAGPVVYNSDGFKEKNLDRLPDNLVEVMQGSKNPFIALLYDGGGKLKRTGTQGQIFCNQLRALEASVDGTRTHFIRTVKPNPEKTPLAMDIMYSLTQLKFSGVFEAVGIKKKGYPFRETFQNFYREYWSLCPPKAADGFDVGPVQSDPSKYQEAVSVLLAGAGIAGVYNGKTRVFYKAEQHRALESQLHVIKNKYAIVIQKDFRRKMAMLYVAEVRHQAANLQRALESHDIDTLEAALAQFDAKSGGATHGHAEAKPVFAARAKLKQLKLETTLLKKVEEFLLAVKEHRVGDVFEDIIATLEEVDQVRRMDKSAFRGPRWDILEDLRKEAHVYALRKELRALRIALDEAVKPINVLLSGTAADQNIDFEGVKAECDRLHAAAKLIEDFALADEKKPGLSGVDPFRQEAMRQETGGAPPSSMFAPHIKRSAELRRVMDEQQAAVSRLEALIRAGDKAAAASAVATSDDSAEMLFDPITGTLRLASLRTNIDAIHACAAASANDGYPVVAQQLLEAQAKARSYLPLRMALYRASLDDRVHHPAANAVYADLQVRVRECLATGIRSDDVRVAAEKIVVRRSVLDVLKRLRVAMKVIDLDALHSSLKQADSLKLVVHPDSYVRLIVAQAIARERQLKQARAAIIDAFKACVRDIRDEEKKNRAGSQEAKQSEEELRRAMGVETAASPAASPRAAQRLRNGGFASSSSVLSTSTSDSRQSNVPGRPKPSSGSTTLQRFRRVSRMAKLLGRMGKSLLVKGIDGTAIDRPSISRSSTASSVVLLAPNSSSGNVASPDSTASAMSNAKTLATITAPELTGINKLRQAIQRAQVCGLPLDHYERIGSDSSNIRAVKTASDDDLVIGRAVRLFNNLSKLEAEAKRALDELDREHMASVLVDCLQVGLEFPPYTDRIAALLRLPALDFEQRKLQALVKQKRWAPAIDLSMRMSLRILHTNLRAITLARAKDAFAMATAAADAADAPNGSGHHRNSPLDRKPSYGSLQVSSSGSTAITNPGIRRLREVTVEDTTMYCDFRRYKRLTPAEVWFVRAPHIPVASLWLSAESVAVFSSSPIHRSLVHVESLNASGDRSRAMEHHRVAASNFQDILLFTGLILGSLDDDLEGEALGVPVLTRILQLGIENPLYREEIYCQLLKQLTPPRVRGAPNAPPFVRDRTAALLCCCLNAFAPPFGLLDFAEYAIDRLSPSGIRFGGGVGGRSRNNPRHRLRRQLRFALHRTLTVGSLLAVPRPAVLTHALRAGEYLFDGARECSTSTVRVDYPRLYAGTGNSAAAAASYPGNHHREGNAGDDTDDDIDDIDDSLLNGGGITARLNNDEETKGALEAAGKQFDFNDQVYVAVSNFQAETDEEMSLEIGDEVILISMEQLDDGAAVSEDPKAAADLYSELLHQGWVAARRLQHHDVNEGKAENKTKGIVPLSFLEPVDAAETGPVGTPGPHSSGGAAVSVSEHHTHAFAIKAYDGSRNAVDLPANVGDIFALVHDVPAMAGYVMVGVPVVDADDIDEENGLGKHRYGQLPADVLELIPPEVTHVAAFEYDGQADDELTLVPGDLLIHHHWVPCDEGWIYLETLQGAQGIAPESFVSPLP